MKANLIPHCWQYLVRQKNLSEDLSLSNMTYEKMKTLKVSDFKFSYVPRENKERCQEIKEFIIRHEWLGIMPHRPTHRFIATYRGELAGVIIMATPNCFSHLLGRENRNKEKLISRGACISWSPKNLASALIMHSIRWMVKNTSYRYFTAYSDTTAGELGTIYQACNFIYLGQNSGERFQYFNNQNPHRGWFSERLFRKSSSIKKYARECEVEWNKNWHTKDKILWDNMPPCTTLKIKNRLKKEMIQCRRRKIPRKHKYVYIQGRDKQETRKLHRIFYKINPNSLNLPYPKQRMPVAVSNFK